MRFDGDGIEMIRDDGRRDGMIFSLLNILAQFEFGSWSQQTYRKHVRALRGNGQFQSFAVCLLV
jgi:hypothetical protein